MSDWQMAQMISNATGMDLEGAYHKINMAQVRENMGKPAKIEMVHCAEEPVSAKEFVDVVTKTFGIDRSSAISSYSRQTGCDWEGVFHEANRVELKPVKGTFTPPSTRPCAPPPEGLGELLPSSLSVPTGSLRVPPTNEAGVSGIREPAQRVECGDLRLNTPRMHLDRESLHLGRDGVHMQRPNLSL